MSTPSTGTVHAWNEESAISVRTDAAKQADTARHGDWLLMTALILVAVDLRPGIVSTGPILPLIIAHFNLSHTFASLLTTIPDLLMGLLALPTPWLARRFGREAVIMVALIVLCVSMAARAFAPDSAVLLICTAGVGAGIAIAGALFAGLIKARFPTRVAVVMGIYSTAISLGSTVSAAASGPIAQGTSAGWRLATGIWAVLGVTAIAAWGVVLLAEHKQRASKAPTGKPTPLPLANAKAWAVALFFACVNFLFYALLSWTAPLFQEAGVPASTAGLILASFTAAFMLASPVVGWLSKSTDRRPLLAVCGAITITGLLGVALAPSAAPFLFVPVCAFGLGGAFTLGMTLPLDNTDSADEANTWNAFVLTVGYLIAAAGPLFVGAMRDLTGGFKMPFTALLAVAVAMLILTPFLKPRTTDAARIGQPR